MAEDDSHDPEAGNRLARGTFIVTMLFALGFVGSIVVFILLR
jgi:hypothetical protein